MRAIAQQGRTLDGVAYTNYQNDKKNGNLYMKAMCSNFKKLFIINEVLRVDNLSERLLEVINAFKQDDAKAFYEFLLDAVQKHINSEMSNDQVSKFIRENLMDEMDGVYHEKAAVLALIELGVVC